MIPAPTRLREPGFGKRPGGYNGYGSRAASRDSNNGSLPPIGREGSLPPIGGRGDAAGSPPVSRQQQGNRRASSVGRRQADPSPGAARENSLPPMQQGREGSLPPMGGGTKPFGSPPESGARPPRPVRQNSRSRFPEDSMASLLQHEDSTPAQPRRPARQPLSPLEAEKDATQLKPGAAARQARSSSRSRPESKDKPVAPTAPPWDPSPVEEEPLPPRARAGGTQTQANGKQRNGAAARQPQESSRASTNGYAAAADNSATTAATRNKPPPMQKASAPRVAQNARANAAAAASPRGVAHSPVAARPASPPIAVAKAAAQSTPFGGAAMPELPGDDEVPSGDLIPCPHCDRKFLEEPLGRHVKICQKVFQSQRKKFEVAKQRLPEEALKINADAKRAERAAAKKKPTAGGPGQGNSEKPAGGKMPAWKMKSEQFRAAMRDAKMVDKFKREGRPLSELPAAVPTAPELDDRTPCPHCGRRFGQQQAERHIPQCAKTKARPKPPPSKARPPRR
eukprot:TRINITY_DN12942_c0_g1_i1.p1 TRINITY_DN12942_c0_g1~~TRINITY_DN12942_c0_g1_i1.p1  ORF type:complete len:510 (-),score=135.03 TRINITY_DN12942_c0_g1_i1:79-1608(-)